MPSLTPPVQPALTSRPPAILIARADDAGLTIGANRAIERCVVKGIARNISLQAVTPSIEHAANSLRDLPGASFGCHVTLTCEWTSPRFGPISARDTPSALALSDGGFPHRADELIGRASVDQMLVEAALQIQRLRELGFRLDYLDTHMGVSWLPGLHERLITLASEEGLIYIDDLVRQGRLLDFQPQLGSIVEDITPRLMIRHPMEPTPGIDGPFGPGLNKETVRRQRQQECEDFLAGPVVDLVRSGAVMSGRVSEVFKKF